MKTYTSPSPDFYLRVSVKLLGKTYNGTFHHLIHHSVIQIIPPCGAVSEESEVSQNKTVLDSSILSLVD